MVEIQSSGAVYQSWQIKANPEQKNRQNHIRKDDQGDKDRQQEEQQPRQQGGNGRIDEYV